MHTHKKQKYSSQVKWNALKRKSTWLENMSPAKVNSLVKEHIKRRKNKPKNLREKQAKGHEKLMHKRGHSNTEK